MKAGIAGLGAVFIAASLPCGAAEEAAIRAAVAKSLPLIEQSSIIAIDERPNCFTCHHSGLPVMTFLAARERGFAVDEANLRAQLDFTAASLAKNRDGYRQGKGQGGQAFMAGSALWTLKLGAWQPDVTTEAVASYLIGHQKELRHWRPPSIRPPSEESPFSATFVVIEGLRAFAAPAQKAAADERIQQAREWLAKTPAANTEDRVFRLWSLATAAADDRGPIAAAAQDLLSTQRPDGGWSQLADMESDTYATGTALVALHRAAGLPVADAAFQKGLDWLLKRQLADGSWLVKSRAKPFQKHFESGYPHGKDQFISITAACWATTALVHALPAGR